MRRQPAQRKALAHNIPRPNSLGPARASSPLCTSGALHKTRQVDRSASLSASGTNPPHLAQQFVSYCPKLAPSASPAQTSRLRNSLARKCLGYYCCSCFGCFAWLVSSEGAFFSCFFFWLNPEAWISGEQLDIISFFSFLQFFSFCMGLVCVWLLLLHLEAWNSSHGRLVLFFSVLSAILSFLFSICLSILPRSFLFWS